jgi:DnaJ family protein A protein 5
MRHSSRLMEKDNKKARDSARKEYNETVRVRVTAIDRQLPSNKHNRI